MFQTLMDYWPLFVLAGLCGAAVYAAVDMLIDVIADRRDKAAPLPVARPAPCPVAVIEVVAVPPGQEEEVRNGNVTLFTFSDARRVLNLFCTVSKGEIEQLEHLLGIETLYRPGNAHLVRLGRRGFHQ